ncbi:MAG TPA: hypothetical protein PK263_04975, partial [bacterium]|nr:hypothetical protein [bacterium]
MPLINRREKLFLDFDGTLFDTAAFRDALFNLFMSLGYTKTEILQAYKDECADYKFSPLGMCSRLIRIKGTDLKEFSFGLQGLYSKCHHYVYSDCEPFLRRLDRGRYEVNLLSLGDINFQKAKVDNSRISEYFDNLYYCDTKKSHFLAPIVSHDEYFVFIDDRAENIDDIRDHFPNSLTLEINRQKPDLLDPT